MTLPSPRRMRRIGQYLPAIDQKSGPIPKLRRSRTSPRPAQTNPPNRDGRCFPSGMFLLLAFGNWYRWDLNRRGLLPGEIAVQLIEADQYENDRPVPRQQAPERKGTPVFQQKARTDQDQNQSSGQRAFSSSQRHRNSPPIVPCGFSLRDKTRRLVRIPSSH